VSLPEQKVGVDSAPQDTLTSERFATIGWNWVKRSAVDAAGNMGRDSVRVKLGIAPVVTIQVPGHGTLVRADSKHPVICVLVIV
jgi:hypothetical protein